MPSQDEASIEDFNLNLERKKALTMLRFCQSIQQFIFSQHMSDTRAPF